MDERQQVHGVAAMLIGKYGIRAMSAAKHNALKARHGGDAASAHGWQSVAIATATLLSGDAADDA
jgi:hypothetical protein